MAKKHKGPVHFNIICIFAENNLAMNHFCAVVQAVNFVRCVVCLFIFITSVRASVCVFIWYYFFFFFVFVRFRLFILGV